VWQVVEEVVKLGFPRKQAVAGVRANPKAPAAQVATVG